MALRLLATFLFILNVVNVGFAGGPWPQKKGEGYFQIGYSTKNWNGSYQGTYSNWQLIGLNRNVRETNWMFYGEFGLGYGLTLITDLSYRMQKTGVSPIQNPLNDFTEVLPSGTLSGIGNPGISLKYGLSTKKIATAIYCKWQPNLSSRDLNIGLQTDYNTSSYSVGLNLGSSGKKHYWQTDAGIVVRGNRYGESLGGNAQYGRRIFQRAYLIIDVNYLVSFQNGTSENSKFAQTATFIDNQGYVAYGLKLHSSIYKNICGNIACYSGFGVINQGNQPGGIFGGLAYELKKN